MPITTFSYCPKLSPHVQIYVSREDLLNSPLNVRTLPISVPRLISWKGRIGNSRVEGLEVRIPFVWKYACHVPGHYVSDDSSAWMEASMWQCVVKGYGWEHRKPMLRVVMLQWKRTKWLQTTLYIPHTYSVFEEIRWRSDLSTTI